MADRNVKKKTGKEKGAGKKARVAKAKADWGDDKASKANKDIHLMNEVAMENANNICHNVQDLLYFRGFAWEGLNKKGKGKTRKKKGAGGKK